MKKNTPLLLIFILVGIIAGGLIGDVFGKSLPILSYGRSIGFDSFTVDLAILQWTMGLKLQLNVAGIIGLLISMFLFKRF
ncbi:DUF4321 domain-containing protein [Acidaminobacter hydrogenoformans]|uniref:DUF4321 domain-containing protein n=1 Tax=Acidaminobacter hydrogenoformans DSM 2784 TaxID=1120920 RepID=A0A1G5RSY3_9FIRM|nr:DUF4321 domain-containing protein [Acidaminobacter hydrogenoformans]SCZ77215.1 protein of unknown function [Acidaminobacter hydrogenoformans DSM 2784]